MVSKQEEIEGQLVGLKQELNLKHCNLISLDRQLYLHAQIDALHGVLGYHTEWPRREWICQLEKR